MAQSLYIARKKAMIHCMKSSWKFMPNLNVFLGTDEKDGAMIRFNFRDSKMLRAEKKVLRTEAEKKKEKPNKNAKWIVLQEQKYDKVKLLPNGVIDFNITTETKTQPKSDTSKKVPAKGE